jgi:putative SOS response-associated peptidase YedK
MAGLYEIWRDPEKAEDDPDRFRWTCTVITTDAEDDVGHIHDRMPLMVEKDRWSAWLDPTSLDPSELLAPDPSIVEALELRPVSTEVNSVKNNNASLIERAELS